MRSFESQILISLLTGSFEVKKMFCRQFDSPCLRCNKCRGSRIPKIVTTKMISMPITLMAGVTGGKLGVDWLEAGDVEVNVDRLFTNVLVAWFETDCRVVRLEPLKSVVEIPVSWLDGDDDEPEALDSREVAMEVRV